MSKRHWILLATVVPDAVVVTAAAPNYELAANILLALLMIKASIFVGLYGFRSNWRATAAGRAVMGLVACISVICMLGTVNLLMGGYPGRPVVRLVAFVAIGIMLMNLVLALVAAQREEAHQHDDDTAFDGRRRSDASS
jgi:hypothetical protein